MKGTASTVDKSNPSTADVSQVETASDKKPDMKINYGVEYDDEDKSTDPDTRREHFLECVMKYLDQDWHPLDPQQNPRYITDYEELLGQFKRAWKFRDSMALAFTFLRFGPKVTVFKERAAIFAQAMEQVLRLGHSPEWNNSGHIQTLYDCRTLEDFQLALWRCELINPGAWIAKIYSWHHSEPLADVTIESLRDDCLQVPFLWSHDPILPCVVKAYAWELALALGREVLKVLKERIPNWWIIPKPKLSYEDLIQCELRANIRRRPHPSVVPQSVDPHTEDWTRATTKQVQYSGNKVSKKKWKKRRRNKSGDHCYRCGDIIH